MRNNYTFEDVVLEARRRGGECLSGEYMAKGMQFKCQHGHAWSTKPRVIMIGSWCGACAKNRKGTIEEMHQIMEGQGVKCVSTKYEGCHGSLEWECSSGDIFDASPSEMKGYIKRIGPTCPKCYKRWAKMARRHQAKLSKSATVIEC